MSGPSFHHHLSWLWPFLARHSIYMYMYVYTIYICICLVYIAFKFKPEKQKPDHNHYEIHEQMLLRRGVVGQLYSRVSTTHYIVEPTRDRTRKCYGYPLRGGSFDFEQNRKLNTRTHPNNKQKTHTTQAVCCICDASTRELNAYNNAHIVYCARAP